MSSYSLLPLAVASALSASVVFCESSSLVSGPHQQVLRSVEGCWCANHRKLDVVMRHLRDQDQRSLLAYIMKCPDASLVDELSSIDWKTLQHQRTSLHTIRQYVDLSPPVVDLTPPQNHPVRELAKRKLGCVIMAGGMATRLQVSCPKGTVPVSPVFGKSLFQMLFEKVAAFEKAYQATVYVGVMTSQETDRETRAFLSKNSFFGLDSSRVSCFEQPSLPFLDSNGQIVVVDGHVITGPDGNGSLFSSCVGSNTLDMWEKAGVEAISIIPIDNPLIDPFLPDMLLPVLHGHQITAAAVRKKHPKERVGVFAREKNKTIVVEYIDQGASDLNGWANISFFVTTPQFMRKAAAYHFPLHVAKKRRGDLSICKSESFVFDCFDIADEICIVPIDRKKYFAPIKNAQGEDSIATAQAALIDKDRERAKEMSLGEIDVSKPVELMQQAYYPLL